jgi:hypothetical protein
MAFIGMVGSCIGLSRQKYAERTIGQVLSADEPED